MRKKPFPKVKPRDYAKEYQRRLDKKPKPTKAERPLMTWAEMSDAEIGYVQEGEFYYFDC